MKLRDGFALVGTACVGAAVMYLADPVSGKRRLSLIRDEVGRAKRKIARTASRQSKNIRNRLYGIFSESKSFFGTHRGPRSVVGHIRRVI